MFLFHKWSELSMHMRMKMAHEFGISRSGTTHVSDNRIVQDGFNFKEVEAKLTVEALQNYLGSKSADFNELWNDTLDKLEGKEKVTSTHTVSANVEVDIPVPNTPLKPKRTKKKK